MTVDFDFYGHFDVFKHELRRKVQRQPGCQKSHADLVEWDDPFGHINALPDTSAESATTLPLFGRRELVVSILLTVCEVKPPVNAEKQKTSKYCANFARADAVKKHNDSSPNHEGDMRLSPWLTQTVKTMFAVRCEILDRQDHFIAF